MAKNYPIPATGTDTTAAVQYDGVIFTAATYVHGSTVHYSPEYCNPGARGARFYINVTNVNTTGTLDLKLQNFDPASQAWMDVPDASITQITSASAVVWTIYPGQEEDLGSEITTPLGLRWRLAATVGTADVAFSVGGDYLDR